MKRALSTFLLLLLVGCGQETYRLSNENPFISTRNNTTTRKTAHGIRKDQTSSSAGNLMATAIREIHDLDIALYPADLINEENQAFVAPGMNSQQIDSVLNLYPRDGNKDLFLVGLMRGRDIRKLVRTRVQDTFKVDIEVAGMVYNVHTLGGVIQSQYYGLDNGRSFDDSAFYRIAINQHFFFSGETFPSYRFRNGLNFSFLPTGDQFSARQTLNQYLAQTQEFPYLQEARARYSELDQFHKGEFKTYQIQGNSHRSPLWGHKVKTGGIVTAVDNVEWYPRGIDIIIQDPTGDRIDETSDALHLHLTGDVTDVRVGDSVSVEGTVFENMTLDQTQNMSKTVIRNITSLKILDRNQKLPPAVVIGKQGRTIPNRVLSTWVGDLNFKPFLTLTDGIDFWESLEGMRVILKNPRVAGFRGGKEELSRRNAQQHLSLYLVPDGFARKTSETLQGGITEDFMAGDFNPEVIHMAVGNLSNDATRFKPKRYRNIRTCLREGGQKFIDEETGKEVCELAGGIGMTEFYYNVGDIIRGDIEGIISFESNLFGGAEYTFVLPYKVEQFHPQINPLETAPCIVRRFEYTSESFKNLMDLTAEESTRGFYCQKLIDARSAVNAVRDSLGEDVLQTFNESQAKERLALRFLNETAKPSFTSFEADTLTPRLVNCAESLGFGKSTPMECRPVTTLKGEGKRLTIAAYNLENLAGNQDDRIPFFGTAIRHNLKCPDILSLVEVQDDNGLDLQGGANAEGTINKIIKASSCKEDGVDYDFINIDPLNHNEGGQPGGNIQVAFLYNKNRVQFNEWSRAPNTSIFDSSLRETRVTADGNLSVNPGRVFPNSQAFKNTRKSIVAQFEFMGEKVFVIGNHFNSKLGDSSFWGANQPPVPQSDFRRADLASTINEFIRILELREPNAHIAVVGDFNAQYNERSMLTLMNDGDLINLMFHKDLVKPADRYSHNYNGNSAAIDFIFANKNFVAKSPRMEVIHINSDYMGRLADHDPVVALFQF